MTRPSPSTVTDEGLVERVARALSVPEHHTTWDLLPDAEKDLYRAQADYAIQELGHTALLRDNERLHDWLADTQMLSFKWMEAHDKLKDGKPYDLPKPADLPERVAALLREIEVLREALEVVKGYVHRAIDVEPPLDAIVALDAISDVCSAALSRPLDAPNAPSA